MTRRNLILSFLGLLLLLEFGVLLWQLSEDGSAGVSLDPNGPGEKITQIAAELRIRTDGSIHIREVLGFRSELDQIKKGLYRSQPLSLEGEDGKKQQRSYTLESVKFDGDKIEVEAGNQGDLYLMQLRQLDPPLEAGTHSFEIDYVLRGAIEQHPTYDQIRYNITGAWTLPVLRASAVVYFPQYLQSKSIIVKGFTGTEESKKQNFLSDSPKENVVRLWTTQPLLKGDQFQFEIRMPKGFISG